MNRENIIHFLVPIAGIALPLWTSSPEIATQTSAQGRGSRHGSTDVPSDQTPRSPFRDVPFIVARRSLHSAGCRSFGRCDSSCSQFGAIRHRRNRLDFQFCQSFRIAFVSREPSCWTGSSPGSRPAPGYHTGCCCPNSTTGCELDVPRQCPSVSKSTTNRRCLGPTRSSAAVAIAAD